MVSRLLPVGVVLLLAGALGAFVAELGLSGVQQTYDSSCAVPFGTPQSSFCRSVHNEIHLWQAALYIALLSGGTGFGLLVLEVASRPRKRVPVPNRGYAAR